MASTVASESLAPYPAPCLASTMRSRKMRLDSASFRPTVPGRLLQLPGDFLHGQALSFVEQENDTQFAGHPSSTPRMSISRSQPDGERIAGACEILGHRDRLEGNKHGPATILRAPEVLDFVLEDAVQPGDDGGIAAEPVAADLPDGHQQNILHQIRGIVRRDPMTRANHSNRGL